MSLVNDDGLGSSLCPPQPPSLGSTSDEPAPPEWPLLFNESRATPLGEDFLGSVFKCLDTNSIGLLAPEQYSAFLATVSCDLDCNIWKRSLNETFEDNQFQSADSELRNFYTKFGIAHILYERASDPQTGMHYLVPPSPIAATSVPLLPPLTEANTPMLTLQGFIDVMTMDVLRDPLEGWKLICRMARYYGVCL
ncbi:hypothetical protein DL95DRAFT_465756 [Leptodontidium sp. 2 PMI_412]|nr:hypothetical protein DL95DRAFT_465756 [Leptodontidium sp. 2 PMI_412]